MTVGQALMRPHENYGKEVWEAREYFGSYLRGVAHITGGGIAGNTKRLLPDGLNVRIDNLPDNHLFRYLQTKGEINEFTMNKTYNRGVGLVFILSNKQGFMVLPDKYTVIGRVEKS